MIVTFPWLKEHLKTKANEREIIDKLINIGLEVEGFKENSKGLNEFKIAKDIDANYYKDYIEAKKAGVNFLAYRCYLSSKEIKIEKKIKILNE